MLRIGLVGVLIAGFSGTVAADIVGAPRGWNETVKEGARIASNGVATVSIAPWQQMHGQSLEAWLQSVENQPPEGASFVSSAGVKPETVQGAYSVIRKVDFAGSKGHSVLYACPGTEGYARLMTLNVTDANFKDTLVGAMFGESVCKKEKRVAGSPVFVQSEKAPSTPSKLPSEQTSANVVAGSEPPGLKELRGVIVMGIQPGGMFGITDDFIALFNDGSYTSDLVNTFGAGITESKNKKPKSWGKWRDRGGELQLRDHGDDAFDKTRGSWLIERSSADYKLSGCFGRLNSSSGADYNSGTTVGLARTWCFWSDGRFTNSSTAFGSSSNVSMRATGPKARGSYRIKGYVARFVYDDGHSVSAAFGYASTKGNHILLNGKRFMGKKR